jgi:transposase-like protein
MDIEATAIVTAYKALAAAQQRPGIEFGRLCFNFRKRSKVVSGGTTFDSTLDKLDIPRSTAYRWIARYEESIGMREKSEPAPKKPVASFPSVSPEPVSFSTPEFDLSSVEESSVILSALAESPVIEPYQSSIPSPAESDTTKLRALFERTGLNLKPSTTARSGIDSVQGKYDLCGLTKKQVERIAKVVFYAKFI